MTVAHRKKLRTIECPDDGSPLFVKRLGHLKIVTGSISIEGTDWSLVINIGPHRLSHDHWEGRAYMVN